ncbi:MAG TPA: hypothetical protein VLL97_15170 [Acidobacteriota bacterium]|nr:hypothetical protein [Acidobacteriota bacterium]
MFNKLNQQERIDCYERIVDNLNQIADYERMKSDVNEEYNKKIKYHRALIDQDRIALNNDGLEDREQPTLRDLSEDAGEKKCHSTRQ